MILHSCMPHYFIHLSVLHKEKPVCAIHQRCIAQTGTDVCIGFDQQHPTSLQGSAVAGVIT